MTNPLATTQGARRLQRLLNPQSVAIVGASAAANKLAGQIGPSLLRGGFQGKLYPINPKYPELYGVPCHPSLSAVGAPIDHVIVSVPRALVPAVLAECRAIGAGSASIYSSGYAEVGEAGAKDQAELAAAAGDLPFLGPNCMGFANLVDRVLATTAAVLDHDSQPGRVALLSQSGGLAFATLCYFASERGLHFSHVVNTGNTAGIRYRDLIDYMVEDPHTDVLFLVVESNEIAAEVIETVAAHGAPKPAVLLKLGRGDTGARMALSHTGSLAGDYRIVQACAEQVGIACADDVDDAIGLCDLLRRGVAARDTDAIAALSISGGNVTLFADLVDASPLRFAHLSAATEEKLRGVLPSYISVHNPIDLTALAYEDHAVHENALRAVAADPDVSMIVPILTTVHDYTPVAEMLAALRRTITTPIVTLWAGGSYETRSSEILRDAEIPVFRTGTGLIRALARLRRVGGAASLDGAARDDAREASPVPSAPRFSAPPTESDALRALADAGLQTPAFEVCARAEVESVAALVGYPIVVKADAAETHVSDTGGVVLGIRDAADLARRRREIDAMPSDEVIVARYLPGEELIVSFLAHPTFGPLLLVGSGGRLADLLADVSIVRLPATREALRRALVETVIGRGLQRGFRGATGFDAAVAFLERFAAVAYAWRDRIAQIEMNPVTVGAHGAAAVDAMIHPAPARSTKG